MVRDSTDVLRRPRLARLAACLAMVFWGVLFFGLVDLLVVVFQDERFYDDYLLETGWGLLYAVMTAVPFLAVVVRPRAVLPLLQPLAVAVAVAVAAAIAAYPRQLIPAALLVLSVVVTWIAGGYRRLPHLTSPDRRLLGLAALAAPGCLWYAADMAGDWQSSAPDITIGLDHRPMQAALGLAVLLTSVLAAFGARDRTPGWLVLVSTVVVSVAWLGIESMIYPELSGSLGVVPGACAVCWALAFAGLARSPLDVQPDRQ
ncbi:MAG: hypothetical protein AVDCRST_MAG34-2668 [uncultured Nocardioidaceae bacterium]|uniref:Uncharacterized protein n=1 Tax=uncultured Nocardioidaceae bacterium TaxID=253824 RepID=A0A6J4MQ03_9ACTN|nr:MAG: hypothetical protein AVDCRST_MAG34-2668 [uncultured Nocardioidaceae bacterium]